jgi:hypothetical protein
MRIQMIFTLGLSCAILLSAAACAGYRGGWYSLAYVGDPPNDPSAPYSASELQQLGRLAFPGLTLQASLNNRLQTGDRKVILFVVPAGYDTRDRRMNYGPADRVRLYLTLTIGDQPWTFDPQAVTLTIDGVTASAKAGHLYGRWNAAGEADPAGEYTHQPLTGPLILAAASQHELSVDFETAIPAPQKAQISADVSKALQSVAWPAIPVVKFKAVRWKQGYT